MGGAITLSVSHADDAPDLIGFYTSNPHAFYAFRDGATERAAADGMFILARRGGAIVAASGLFPVPIAGDAAPHFELGQARSVPAGKGLYRWMVWLRLLRAEALGIAPERIYTEIDEPNTLVQDALTRLGFEAFAPAGPLLEACVASLPPEKRPEALGYGFVFLRPTAAAYRDASAALKALAAGEATGPDCVALLCGEALLKRLPEGSGD